MMPSESSTTVAATSIAVASLIDVAQLLQERAAVTFPGASVRVLAYPLTKSIGVLWEGDDPEGSGRLLHFKRIPAPPPGELDLSALEHTITALVRGPAKTEH